MSRKDEVLRTAYDTITSSGDFSGDLFNATIEFAEKALGVKDGNKAEQMMVDFISMISSYGEEDHDEIRANWEEYYNVDLGYGE